MQGFVRDLLFLLSSSFIFIFYFADRLQGLVSGHTSMYTSTHSASTSVGDAGSKPAPWSAVSRAPTSRRSTGSRLYLSDRILPSPAHVEGVLNNVLNPKP